MVDSSSTSVLQIQKALQRRSCPTSNHQQNIKGPPAASCGALVFPGFSSRASSLLLLPWIWILLHIASRGHPPPLCTFAWQSGSSAVGGLSGTLAHSAFFPSSASKPSPHHQQSYDRSPPSYGLLHLHDPILGVLQAHLFHRDHHLGHLETAPLSPATPQHFRNHSLFPPSFPHGVPRASDPAQIASGLPPSQRQIFAQFFSRLMPVSAGMCSSF